VAEVVFLVGVVSVFVDVVGMGLMVLESRCGGSRAGIMSMSIVFSIMSWTGSVWQQEPK
jgi:hypothetical protein